LKEKKKQLGKQLEEHRK